MALSLLRIFSYVLALAGVSLLLPLAAAVRYGETRAAWSFAVPMAASIAAAVAITVVYRHLKAAPLSVRAAFVAVGGSWILLGFFGALPIWFSGAIKGFANCLFESISGFTTTGATVIFDVESLPRSINLWRCEMHGLGVMGVIALAVALVPLLGIGGMKLIQAETTGPEKGKLTARITNTAKVLWFIYMGFTAAQTALLHFFGLSLFDSLCLSFSTLGTGGFSTRNLSVGSFGNPAVEWVCTIFMLAAAVNFALYYRFFTGRVGEIWRDSEFRAFCGIVAASIAVVALVQLPGSDSCSETVRDSAFQVASIISSTGFMTDDYTAWRPAAQIVLLSLVFIGGCSGSTGPQSIDPDTGKPYNMSFPVTTVADMVRAQKQLVDHLGIKKPMVSYYEHNKLQKTDFITNRLQNGEKCAMISGTKENLLIHSDERSFLPWSTKVPSPSPPRGSPCAPSARRMPLPPTATGAATRK